MKKTGDSIFLLHLRFAQLDKYFGLRRRAVQIAQQIDHEIARSRERLRGIVFDFTGVELVGLAFTDELLAQSLVFVRRPDDDGMFLVFVGANEEVRTAVDAALDRHRAIAFSADSSADVERGNLQLIGANDELRELYERVSASGETRASELKDMIDTSRTNTANRLKRLREYGVVAGAPTHGKGQPLAYKAAFPPKGNLQLVEAATH
ncbi:MAG TPA: hypothetical protein VI056_05515 [Candidatus Limnocylindria bacterium]